MRVTRQPVYVLHTRPYRESSLLIDIFSRDHGRCMLIAKGARRQKSRFRGLLMPFKPLLIGWTGKGSLPTLTMVETSAHLPEIKRHGLYAGFYVNELLLKLLHRFDAHTGLFFAYDNTIRCLSSGDDLEHTLRIFEKQLLREVGYGLILDHDVETGELIDSDVQYVYSPESGPVATTVATRTGVDVQGSTLQQLDFEAFLSDHSRIEARRLTQVQIRHQLGRRKLHSQQVFHQLLDFQKRNDCNC